MRKALWLLLIPGASFSQPVRPVLPGCGVRPQLRVIHILGGAGGTGFKFAWKGREYVATNQHVAEGQTLLAAEDEDGRTATLRYLTGKESPEQPPEVPKTGYYSDWAVLDIVEGRLDATVLRLSRATDVHEGPAYARGFPYKKLMDTDLLVHAYQGRLLAGQMASVMWFGASGSPVVDCAGEVVGANYGTCREPRCFRQEDDLVYFSPQPPAGELGLMQNRLTPVQALIELLEP